MNISHKPDNELVVKTYFEIQMPDEEFYGFLYQIAASVRRLVRDLRSKRINIQRNEDLVGHILELETLVKFLYASDEFIKIPKKLNQYKIDCIKSAPSEYQSWKRNALRRCKDKELRRWFSNKVFARIDWSAKRNQKKL